MSRPTLLSVDDSADDCLLLDRAWLKAGAEANLRMVDSAISGIEYLTGGGIYGNRAQHPLPQMVLVDLNMPGTTGFELLHWLDQRRDFDAVCAAVFTSSDNRVDISSAYQYGANYYFVKPAGFHALVVFAAGVAQAMLASPDRADDILRNLKEYRPG